MIPKAPKVLLFATLMIAGLLAGCGDDPPPPEAGSPPVVETSEQELPAAPLSASELRPVIREVAPALTSPEKVVVEFARPVVDEAAVGKPPAEGTVLEIRPQVPGELQFTSPSTLTFTPREGFAPSQRYEVELTALQTTDGILTPPSSGRWVRVFESPPFDFLRLAVSSIDPAKNQAEVLIAFSGPVEVEEVRRRASFSVDPPGSGRTQQRSAQFEAGDDEHSVIARLSGSDIVSGSRIELSLEAGTPSLLDRERVADSGSAWVVVETGPEAKVLHAYRAESENGFYIQVICDDRSVSGRRYYWDRETYNSYELSTRCLLDEDEARTGVRFEPEVDFTVSPAGGGFRIFGDFARGSYQMQIDAGLRTTDGGMLRQAWNQDFSIPARSPQIAFTSRGRYLPRSAWSSLPVRHRNISGATLVVHHVPAENLVFWMSGDSEQANERTSNLILQEKLTFSSQPDEMATTEVDLSSMIPQDTRGLLEIQLLSGNARATSRLLLTDLHLIAKRGGASAELWKEVEVWAVDMKTLEPQRGVTIDLVRKSGYVMDTCETGSRGGCRLVPRRDAKGHHPAFAVVARRGQDLTYLEFADLEAEVQEERIAGEPYSGSQPYRAALYSDRGVYRPGETAHLAAIVRQEDHLAPPAAMPVQLHLLDPQGKKIRSTTLETNAAGTVDLDLPFPAFATTGRYEAQLEVAKRRIGQYSFQVEEFVPERMKVEVASEAPQYKLGDEPRLEVAARYLFGGVPAEHRVELACELVPGNFAPTANAEFDYGVWRTEDTPLRPLDLGKLDATLDEQGRGTFACPGRAGVVAGPAWDGPASLVARAAVFEAGGGRTTLGSTAVPVHPESFYIGLKSSASEAEAGTELVVEGITVDWRGQPVEEVATVTLELVRLDAEYGWYYDEVRGRETWRRFQRQVPESRQEVAVVNGRFRASLRPERSGEGFLIRARAGEARTEIHLEGSGWYYWQPDESQVDQTPRPGRPTWLAVKTPDAIRPGERFPVQMEIPYRGRVLLTTESDRLLSSEWIEVEAGDLAWFLEVEDFVPNVYVSAFLIKDPHLDSEQAFLPDRAFGVTSVKVEPEAFRHALSVEAPDEVRSSSTLTVTLDLGDTRDEEGPVYATVAAVDEGILSLTRFESPDPFAQIFTRRALGVETFETVGWTLLVPPSGPSSVSGGDGAVELGRVQPIQPVALWSGLVEVPESGELSLDFEVPQYRGELRVMAVTAGRQRMGRAETRVTVRDPLTLQATLPRFLTRDDEFHVPVQVTNLSGQDRDLRVLLAAESVEIPGFEPRGQEAPVEILGPRQEMLRLAEGDSSTVVFRARARQPIGAAKLRVEVLSDEIRAVEEQEIPILPAGPKSRVRQRFELTEGTTELADDLEGWLPLSERTVVWVSRNPYGETFGHLEHLVRYPYGCIEQTTSSTRPLLYLGDLIDNIDPGLTQGAALDDLIAHGIDRLLSMQTPSGGFAYWPGGIEPAYWGTAYATHLLLDARELDFPVPEARLDDALDWMERQISSHYEAGQESWYSRHAEPYMHYVLALAGRPQQARAETLLAQDRDRNRGQKAENDYLLKAALFLAGDQRYRSELKNPDLSPVRDQRNNGWSFYSDRRRRGLMLSTFVDLFGQDPAAEPLADLVVEALRGESRGYTTQELVWGITGLGKLLDSGADSFAPPVLRADGRVLPPRPQRAKSNDRTWSVIRASEYERLSLEVPEKGEGKLFLMMTSEGVREAPDWRTGGAGLKLTRRYLDAGGAPLDLDRGLALGDVVMIELQITNTGSERVANIALVDRIPAGWEIENPRLGRDGGTGWIDPESLWKVDHMDLRDDRLEAFGHLERGQTGKVVYAVRAVTAGSFTIPSVEAEAMYDPRIWAREASRPVIVRGPWEKEPAVEVAAISDPDPAPTATTPGRIGGATDVRTGAE